MSEQHVDDLEAFEAYLADQQYTLWCNWSIDDPKRRKQAAAWFISEVDRFDRWYRNNWNVPTPFTGNEEPF